MHIRVIPTLLIHKGGLVKSVRFKEYKYVGDPINAVRIFNDKEVDEICILDIDASRDNRGPNFEQIAGIASEAFMPMSYGGGISRIDEIRQILYSGVEKVIVNKAAWSNPDLITKAANLFGSQSVIVSIDAKKSLFNGYRVYTDNGRTKIDLSPVEFARRVEAAGAGEILLNDISRDGTYAGYNLDLIREVSEAVGIPVICVGGAGSTDDFKKAKESGASAVAAGSMFVFQRPHQAVLISYPRRRELSEALINK